MPLFSLITWPSTLEFVFSQNHAWTLRISKHQDLLMAGGCWNRICLGGVLRQFGVDQLLRPRSQVEKQGLTSGFVVSGFVGVCRARNCSRVQGLQPYRLQAFGLHGFVLTADQNGQLKDRERRMNVDQDRARGDSGDLEAFGFYGVLLRTRITAAGAAAGAAACSAGVAGTAASMPRPRKAKAKPPRDPLHRDKRVVCALHLYPAST